MPKIVVSSAVYAHIAPSDDIAEELYQKGGVLEYKKFGTGYKETFKNEGQGVLRKYDGDFAMPDVFKSYAAVDTYIAFIVDRADPFTVRVDIAA